MQSAILLSLSLATLPLGQVRVQLKLYDPATDRLSDATPADPRFQSALPSAVLVPGWNPTFNDFDPRCSVFRICRWDGDLNANSAGEAHWIVRLIRQMRTRVDANFLAWDWLEESNVPLGEAVDRINDESLKCANALKTVLPENSTQPLHAFGHSLGVFLITTTCLELLEPRLSNPGTRRVDQVTLFDPFDHDPFRSFEITSNLTFRVSALRIRDVYVDQYHGATSDPHHTNIWVNVPGAIHDVYNWYRATIPPGLDHPLVDGGCNEPLAGSIGFNASILVGANRVPAGNCAQHGTIMFERRETCSDPFDIAVFGVEERRDCRELLPPVANAGPDQAVAAGADGTAEVQLDASATTDPDEGDILMFAWFIGDQPLAEGVRPTVWLPRGAHRITLRVSDSVDNHSNDDITVEVTTPFLRGDADGSRELDISDPIVVLLGLFAGRRLDCHDAADANDDGNLNITDPLFILNFLFRAGVPPLPPFPQPGADPTPDALDCNT